MNLVRTVYSSRWDGIKFMLSYILLGLSYIMVYLGIIEFKLLQRDVVGFEYLHGNLQLCHQEMHLQRQESPSSFVPYLHDLTVNCRFKLQEFLAYQTVFVTAF